MNNSMKGILFFVGSITAMTAIPAALLIAFGKKIKQNDHNR